MNDDPTETARREMQATINAAPVTVLPEPHWDTEALQRDFEVEGFCAPFVVVRRKKDGKKGTLMFKHHPRVYFDFQADEPGK